LDASFLSKTGGGRKRKASGKRRESPPEEHTAERGEEGGPDEAVAFIAETVAELVKLAERHRLEVLGHLLGMAQLEAEERLRTRSKHKLS
jgi:hypothetical protein